MSPYERFVFDCCWLPAYAGLWVFVGWWAAATLFVVHIACNATVTRIKEPPHDR